MYNGLIKLTQMNLLKKLLMKQLKSKMLWEKKLVLSLKQFPSFLIVSFLVSQRDGN